MSNRTDVLMSKLEAAIANKDFLILSEEVADELLSGNDGKDAIEPILRLMELNETVDFGMPGALVHFVERFYLDGYEEELLNSINRRATPHTLWMLNRISNGSSGNLKALCIEAMRGAQTNSDLSTLARESAREFLTNE